MTLLTSRSLRITAVSGAALLVASCAETQLGAQAVKEVARSDAAAPAAASGPKLAPDAFDVTGLTIWDGASTLEGIWVAHPLAQKAQRVRMTNQENQIAIEGAMFRRNPTLSGPSILVSSDAARILGLQPGIPTEMRIVALREGGYAEPSATAVQPAPGSSVETTALPAPEPIETNLTEPETAEVAETEPAPEFQATETAETAPPTPEPTAALPAPTPAPEPTETLPAVDRSRPKSAITAADLRGTTTETPAPEAELAQPAQPAIAAAAAQPVTPDPTPATRPATQQATAPSASASGAFQGDLPSGLFVQAGAFGVEGNAATLVQTLQGSGLPTQYVQREINGSLFNIVMIGPLTDDAAADAAIVSAAKAGAAGARKVVR